jgi:tRNA pseudouridine55 synthase
VDGVLLLDKPPAWTSHDLVDAVRRKIGQKSVGHAGTLDPMATGLMILLLGKATKRSAEFTGLDKSYRGSIRLGVVTDSWDLDGRVLEEKPAEVSEKDIREAVLALSSQSVFLPPSFSAIKIGGRKAYAMARRGETVKCEPRPMTLHRFVIDGYEAPEIYFTIDCSKGTYIRSVAHALGERLGCGAALSSLVRTRVGEFRLENALPFDELKEIPLPALEKRLLA